MTPIFPGNHSLLLFPSLSSPAFFFWIYSYSFFSPEFTWGEIVFSLHLNLSKLRKTNLGEHLTIFGKKEARKLTTDGGTAALGVLGSLGPTQVVLLGNRDWLDSLLTQQKCQGHASHRVKQLWHGPYMARVCKTLLTVPSPVGSSKIPGLT